MGQTGAIERILLLAEDVSFRQSLAEQMMAHLGIETVGVSRALDAKALFEEQKIDLILADITVPGLDGGDFYKLMRFGSSQTPAIIFVETDADIKTALSLGFGPEQCITKPFRLGLLLARIRSLSYEQDLMDQSVMVIGQYSFRPENKCLVHDETETEIRLTGKETSILEVLYLFEDQVVSRDVLLDKVWGYKGNVATHTLATHIYRLRQKLESVPSQSEILMTGPGGYRLRR